MIQDFHDLLTELLRSDAKFLVVGAHALSGLPPYRLDVLTSISGASFDVAWEARAEGTIEGVRVPVIGLAAFVQNKRATGRTKDLADLESLGEDHQ